MADANQFTSKSQHHVTEPIILVGCGGTVRRDYIGVQGKTVVQQADDESHKRIKYASAHDLWRGCAQRLINAGVSVETLKIVMRHRDFSTTERF